MRSTFIAILMFVGAVLGAVAQNTVFVSNVKGAPGEVVNVDVLLQNTDDVAAAEVVIPLVNKQLTYVDGSCVINSERANGHSLSAAVVDGVLKIYIYSFSGAPLNGDDGRLASFSLKLGNSPAEYPLQPQVVLSDATGKALPVNTSAGAVTILAPQIEVVTPSVDFGRVPIMAQYTKNFTLRNSGTLPLEVSDLQFNDNAFSIAETSFTIAAGATRNITINYSPTVRGVVDKSITVVSNAANGNATVKLLAEPYSVNELHSSRVEGIAGEEVTVELRMNNMEAIVGLQTTFNLPNGIEYVDGSFAATERAASHTSMASFSNGKLSLFLYSMKNTPMSGNDGVVATFRLRLKCNSGSYNIVPQNTVLSNAAQENMVSAVSGEYIVVKSPDIDGNTELDFGRTPVTEVAKANYSVRNNGKATLEISNVVFLAQGYKVANELPLTIEPGAVSVLNVEYLPAAEGAHSTSMNIYSNDPDEKMISVKVTGTVYEPNNLTFEGENLQNGDYVMSIGLDNYTGIVAMQMDIHWMPGMTTSSDRLKVSERLSGHSCSITKIDEDTYRFIAFSFGNNNIAGNKGKLFDLTFTPGNGTDYKDTPIVIDNVVLSSSGANNYTSQLALNVPASYSHYFVKFVCESEIVSETFQRAGTQIVQPQMPKRTGYTFGGWENVPELSPAEDVVYTGEYKVNKYKLNYLVNGVVFATDSIAYGAEIVLREQPTKEGHTFSGWSEAPATMPANDITIEGSFAVNSYNVIYKVDGEEYKVVPAAYGSEIVLIEELTKEGYTFSGWSEAPATMPAEDVVIEGSFTVNSYNVIYKVDGEEYKVVPAAYGSEIVLIDAPAREGYTFSGWSEAPTTMPAEDVVIEGTFTVNNYNVIYKIDGEEYKIVPVAYGTPVSLIDAPVKEGHTFRGWEGEMQDGIIAYPIDLASNADNMLYSNAYCTDKTYGDEFKGWHVLFDNNPATFFHSEYNPNVKESSDGLEHYIRIDLGTGNEVEKFSFTYSNRQSSSTGSPTKIVVEGCNEANGVYAEIATLVGLPTYNSTYSSDTLGNGNKYRFIRLRVTETYSNQSPSGHPFFYISELGMTKYVERLSIPTVMPAEDVVINGTYTVNSYNVIYKVDGEEYQVVPVTYGSEITLREEPTKEGHAFSGWSETPETMPAKDVTIEGTFTVNSYVVKYLVDGEKFATDSIAFGSEITLREEPTKEGHTFSGWSEAPATMPAKDVTIEGTFAVNRYAVNYKVDGVGFAVDSVAYGSEIILREEPNKEGHTFSGWSEAPATMPASDITIEGTFAVNRYAVNYKVDGVGFAVDSVAYGSEIILREEPNKEGHTFSGWSETPATMPASDITIEGSFTVNNYTVTYLVDGVVFATDSIAYGAEIVLREQPTKEGHTFSGWSEAPATMPASDITIEGAFTVNSYNVIYKVDGEEYKVVPAAYGSEIVLIDAPAKEGHTFSGWSETPATMPASDITIEGSFTVNNYTVTYLVDGEVYATETVAYGSEIVLRDEPTKEGHTFSGWSETPATMPASDITIEGSFAVNTYNVIYKVDGEEYKVVPAAYGSEIVLIDAPVKEGHTFSGWSEAPATMPAEDVVIKGTFAVNYYNVVYFVDGEVYVTDRIAYGKEIVAPEHPVKEGYTFGGWRDVPKTMPAEDIEITSSFVVNGYKVIYKVDGEEYQSELVEYGSMIILPKYPIKEGHTFSGWQNVPESMPAEDVVIEGLFTVNTYNVIYKVDGEEYQVVPVTYGSEIVLIDAPAKEGHTFSGWQNVPESMPAEDITIEGTFTVNNYTVTYLVDGEEFATDYIAFCAEIVLREQPTKEGHTFSGWSEAPATMPAEDITIEGSFTVNSYNVIYKVDGEEYQVVPAAYGSEIVLIDAPAKEGHTFSGWSEAPATMPAKDVTIEGSFAVNNYTVTYLVDGENYATETVAYGSEIVLRDEPTKEGHTFSGWSDAPATMPAEDVVIEGSFTVNTYNVIYKVDGEEYKVVPAAYGSEIVLIEEPTKEGYTFSGWSEAPATMPAKDVTIEGTFTVNSYVVKYLVDGEEFATDSIAFGAEIVLREQPTKEGHTFSGWSEAPATMPAKNVTIEGTFTVNSYVVKYLVDGEEFATDSIAFGAEIVLREQPTKEGHTFSGWSEAPATMPAKDVTIEGTFTVNSYVVKYVVDGEEFATDSIAFGSEIVLREQPTKEGHTFSGWSETPETMPAKDVTIEGTFTVNSYVVKYVVDGEEFATDSIAFGSEITLREAPTKEGHTFSGWSEAPTTMPAEDVVIEGSFTVNTYNVIYKVDGEEYKVVPAAYGSEIILIDAPVKEGHTFSGWSEAPATMPAEDVVIEGSFTVNTYNLIYKVDGEEYKVVPAAYGSEIVLIDAPAKEGHTFSGWSDAPATMPAEDVVIEGSFTANTYNVIYKVDGEEYQVVPVTYGSEITLIEAPTKEGYTFSGWSDAPATMPAEDVVIEGSFTVNTYNVIYKVDGEEFATDSIAFGSEIVLREQPTKEGHTFSGWSDAPATMPAEDVVIEGSFTVNTYNVIYKVDGEEYKVVPAAYGSEIILIDAPVKEGYTFSGWSEAPETMPAEDIVIEGTFTINYYTLTYLVDGEVYATETVAYGSAITLLEEPTKEGYTFSGWSEAPETMPAEDIVIEGSFSPITTINGVVYDAEDLLIYNLRGERIIDVDELERGIYIINGKKVWVE